MWFPCRFGIYHIFHRPYQDWTIAHSHLGTNHSHSFFTPVRNARNQNASKKQKAGSLFYSEHNQWQTSQPKQSIISTYHCLQLQKILPDTAEVRELDREFRRKAKLAKLAYKDKVEERIKVRNAKDAWRGLNTMMGRKNKQQTVKTDNPRGFANELNRFYARFEGRVQHSSWDQCLPVCFSCSWIACLFHARGRAQS